MWGVSSPQGKVIIESHIATSWRIQICSPSVLTLPAAVVVGYVVESDLPEISRFLNFKVTIPLCVTP
jgi:hypothetical protein